MSVAGVSCIEHINRTIFHIPHEMAEKWLCQDFEAIRALHLRAGTLFEDDTFPPKSDDVSAEPQTWRRPDLKKKPQFIVDGASRFDVNQGSLGDCWMLAALDSLTLHKNLFDQVVGKQSFSHRYAGVFHFRFWQYGRWVDVVIDDRLPTKCEDGSLVNAAARNNEYWPALLEKAYAKLNGSYKNIEGAFSYWAMVSFTGGIGEKVTLSDVPRSYDFLLRANKFATLLVCSTDPKDDQEELKNVFGDHAYSITKVAYVKTTKEGVEVDVPLLRIRNPWGSEREWNGAWSDGSSEWNCVSQEEKDKLDLFTNADGEFWICYEDFLREFQYLDICYLSTDCYVDGNVVGCGNTHWKQSVLHGAWERNSTAGGSLACPSRPETFFNNPQFVITLDAADDDVTGDDVTDNSCALVISLTRSGGTLQKNNIAIGFSLFQLPSDTSTLPKPLTSEHLNDTTLKLELAPWYEREVSKSVRLAPGSYCLVPATWLPNQEDAFMLRLMTTRVCHVERHDDSLSLCPVDEKVLGNGVEISADKLKKTFLKFAGQFQKVDWMGLSRILTILIKQDMKSAAAPPGMSEKLMKHLIVVYGKEVESLVFEEFSELWPDMRHWTRSYLLHLSCPFGLGAFELRSALKAAGFCVDHGTLTALARSFSHDDGWIDFDDFCACCVEMKHRIGDGQY